MDSAGRSPGASGSGRAAGEVESEAVGEELGEDDGAGDGGRESDQGDGRAGPRGPSWVQGRARALGRVGALSAGAVSQDGDGATGAII